MCKLSIVVESCYSLMTWRDTVIEAVILLVLQLSVYSPDSFTENGRGVTMEWISFLMRFKKKLCLTIYTWKKQVNHTWTHTHTQPFTYTVWTRSTPLIHWQAEYPERCPKEMLSFIPADTFMLTGSDAFRLSGGTKHATWKTRLSI